MKRRAAAQFSIASHALIVICAEYELCLAKLYTTRIAKSIDKHVASAASHALSKYASRLEIADIVRNLKHFGDDYSNAFAAKRDDPANAQAITAHASVCSNRNSVAHGSGTLLTLVELIEFFSDGRRVFDFAAEAMDFTAPEIAALTWV